jgi:hypothetical protein
MAYTLKIAKYGDGWSTWLAGRALTVGALDGFSDGGATWDASLADGSYYVYLLVDDTGNTGSAELTLSINTHKPDGTEAEYLDANGQRNAIEVIPLWSITISDGAIDWANTLDFRYSYNITRLG